ncbi:DUF4198 domain-containing protein [Cupriavidus taiwanensis]|uniref:Uncharacterized protein n=1 Tax=Cupriavidus taiwanensis TaxID=164546 RepID=A0A7Z7NQ83_9BURK|nr:DUF4198 domain-containing protein [Cupriavidus taiwanensis]SOZ17555.1 conserved exported hypothetical protein [Cupriavidus taiwanensis]SOZ96248.1 conserved exported hypothetical protein [Cupriavidus taiwanensis]SPC25786.1 conserved exported hypothetical protein [Cupriavidus taiwanensis]
MKNNMTRLMQIAAVVGGLTAGMPAGAHYLWLEQGKAEGHLYFGEYEETLRERSPGRLDEMPGPEFRVVGWDGKVTALNARREAGGFRFAVPAKGATVLASESRYAVKDWTKYNLGIVKPMFYARLTGILPPQANPEETLTLDILPTGNAGEFRVIFRNAPLATTEVRIIAPNAWTREATTDNQGLVRFTFPWKGQYILHAVYLERSAGTFDGSKYEAVRHRATATITVPTGAPTTTPALWHASKPQ